MNNPQATTLSYKNYIEKSDYTKSNFDVKVVEHLTQLAKYKSADFVFFMAAECVLPQNRNNEPFDSSFTYFERKLSENIGHHVQNLVRKRISKILEPLNIIAQSYLINKNISFFEKRILVEKEKMIQSFKKQNHWMKAEIKKVIDENWDQIMKILDKERLFPKKNIILSDSLNIKQNVLGIFTLPDISLIKEYPHGNSETGIKRIDKKAASENIEKSLKDIISLIHNRLREKIIPLINAGEFFKSGNGDLFFDIVANILFGWYYGFAGVGAISISITIWALALSLIFPITAPISLIAGLKLIGVGAGSLLPLFGSLLGKNFFDEKYMEETYSNILQIVKDYPNSCFENNVKLFEESLNTIFNVQYDTIGFTKNCTAPFSDLFNITLKPNVQLLSSLHPFPKIGQYITTGSFGKIYHLVDNANYIVKKVSINKCSEDAFYRELYFSCQFNHPHLIKSNSIHLREEEDDEYQNQVSLFGYLVQEKLKQTLDAYIQSDLYSEKMAFKFSIEIALGIHFLHMHNILHRDISLNNIMIDQYGRVRIIDFGISKINDSSHHTSYVGKHEFMAPEVVSFASLARYGYECDVYSYGIVLKHLFKEDVITESSSIGIKRIITTCTKKNPKGRPCWKSILVELFTLMINHALTEGDDQFTTIIDELFVKITDIWPDAVVK